MTPSILKKERLMTRLKTLLTTTIKFFTISLPDRLMEDFRRDMLEESFLRLSVISPALFIIELILLLFEEHLEHIYIMTAFLLASLILIPLIFYIKKNYSTVSQMFKLTVLYAYVLTVLLLGAALSLGVLHQIDMTYVYLMSVLSVALFLLIRPLPLAVLYAFVYALFALLLPYAGAKPEALSSLRVNTAVFNLFAWVFSHVALKSRASVFLNRRQLHEQNCVLEELAKRDAMTGLYHHAASLCRLDEEIRRARAEGHPLSLIMTDIDDFKTINDTYGHQFGDDVISRVAAVFTTTVRDKGTVGRYGGEEFLIILPGTGLADANTLAENIQSAMAGAISQPSVTVSGGISLYQGESLNDFVRQTDERLYHAKSSGKCRFVSAPVSVGNTPIRSFPATGPTEEPAAHSGRPF